MCPPNVRDKYRILVFCSAKNLPHLSIPEELAAALRKHCNDKKNATTNDDFMSESVIRTRASSV